MGGGDSTDHHGGILQTEESQEKYLLEGFLHQLKILPKSLGDVLQKIPLLLEVLMKAQVIILWRSARLPHHGDDSVFPVTHFIPQPGSLGPQVSNLSYKVLAECHNGQPPPLTNCWYQATFHAEITNMILVRYGKYPLGNTCATMLSRCNCMWVKVPPAPASSSYHGFVTCRCATWSYWMSRITPRTYATISNGTPWVTPSLMKRK